MARQRYNNAGGTLGAQLLAAGTTITFASAPSFGTLTSGDHIPLLLEPPQGSTPSANFEIVWVTAYTAGQTTATVARGQEGTTAVDHASGVAWACAPTAADVFFGPEAALFPANVLAETIPRRLVNHNWTFGPQNGQSHFFAIALPAGISIGHINLFFTGASAGATHWWAGLCDSTGKLLAATADQGATQAASGRNSLAIATTAAGSASSFTTQYAGLYYIHYYMNASTTNPSMYNNVSGAQVSSTPTIPYNQAPLESFSISGGLQQATPPAFPFTFNIASPSGIYDTEGYVQLAA